MAISTGAVGDTRLGGSPHGMTLSMVSTGDIRRLDRDLVELASRCDVLVHVQTVPEHHVAHSHSHTEPSETARIAREAGCRTLLLTHFMSKTNAELDAAVQTVQENFSGRVVVAHDPLTLDVKPAPPPAVTCLVVHDPVKWRGPNPNPVGQNYPFGGGTPASRSVR